MPMSTGPYKHLIDKVAESSTSKIHADRASERPIWWYILFMPGKILLWVEYMFPGRLSNIFGSARRRNVPLIQLMYTVVFYALGLFLLFACLIKR
jgi:hypothetical protein